MPDQDPTRRDSDAPQTPVSKSGLDQFAKYSELALVMPAGCAGGWIVGAWLDSKFHTHWIFLVGLILGFVGGFYHVSRIALRNSK